MANTRETILQAAESLFAEHGYDGVSIRDIVSKAGVNLAAIHYHFGTKQKLYQEIIATYLKQVRQSVQELAQSPADPREKIRLFTQRYFMMIYHHPRLSSIMAKEIAHGGHHMPALVERYMRPNFEALCQFIQEGMHQKFFRPVDIQLAAFSLISMCIFFFNARTVALQVLHMKDYSETFIRKSSVHTADLFLAGLKA